MKCFHEHDDGPLEHPRPPNPWVGRLPFNDRGKPLPARATAEGTQGQGSRIYRISTLPEVIAQPGDFAPTPIAPGTSCRENTVFCPVRRDVGKRRARRRRVCLHRRCDERVVRRPVSAKKPDVHQPEVPSIVKPAPEGRRRGSRRC